MDLPIKPTSFKEVEEEIFLLKNKKSPDCKKISAKAIRTQPKQDVVLLIPIKLKNLPK